MSDDQVRFNVTRLAATVPEGVPIVWRGRQFDSGPLVIEMVGDHEGSANQGVLDYGSRRARAELRVQMSFPAFAEILEDLGADPAFTRPLQAVLRSEGDILDDHGFALSGVCELAPHRLLPREATAAEVLPGH